MEKENITGLLTMPPFFSIITSTYNVAETLPRLLDSLAAQTCRDFNWIVQDGASTDETMCIVERYRPLLPEILAESRKDTGIYDAWNRALDRAGDQLGEWVLFLGGDDLLASPEVLEKSKKILDSLPENILYCVGDIFLFDEKKNLSLTVKANCKKSYSQLKKGMSFAHSAMFHNKKLFLTNRFTQKYIIVSDYDFIVKTNTGLECFSESGILTTKMSLNGISGTNEELIFSENVKVIKEYFLFYYILYIPMYHIKMKIKKILYTTETGKQIWNKMKKYKKYFIKNE